MQAFGHPSRCQGLASGLRARAGGRWVCLAVTLLLQFPSLGVKFPEPQSSRLWQASDQPLALIAVSLAKAGRGFEKQR